MNEDTEFVPLPEKGRTYDEHRRVGLGDVDRAGRLRLDALARVLQDIASADAADAHLEGVYAWVVRKLRVALLTRRWPSLGEDLVITTWCGGHGSRWAERRTTIAGGSGARVEAAAVWVAIDEAGRPVRLSDQFFAIWGEAAAARQVSARLRLPGPPANLQPRPWVVRVADLDTLGHVNNAAHWAAVEEVLEGRIPRRAQIDFAEALSGPGTCELWTSRDASSISVWLGQDGRVRSSTVVGV